MGRYLDLSTVIAVAVIVGVIFATSGQSDTQRSEPNIAVYETVGTADAAFEQPGRLSAKSDQVPSPNISAVVSEPGEMTATSNSQGAGPTADESTEHPHFQVIYNYIVGWKKGYSPQMAKEISSAIITQSDQFGVDPRLVTSLVARESGFNPRAVSRSGAKGLGQLMPVLAKNYEVTDPFDIQQNIGATVQHINWLVSRWQNHSQQVKLILASYLEGYGRVKRSGGQMRRKTERYIEDILGIYEKLKL